MAQRKSPKLKKQDRYEKEHRTVMEHPHAFRKNWPKKKARGNRQRRLKEKLVIVTSGDDEIAGKVRSARRGVRAIKNGVKTLKKFIEFKQQWSATRGGLSERKKSEQ